MKQLEHLLLVDDDPTTNFFNKHLVGKVRAFKHIHEASNGKEALEIIKEMNVKGTQPDMILLDINMPIMDGFEFLDNYSVLDESMKSSVVICMLTTSLAKEDLERSKKYAVLDDYIDKPLYEAKILELIEKHFG
ncbi:MAG: response regulator [Crocinitomicaceae bacterium]|nr:response regulator [Crocinitomicaceae bacterium]